jgi:hypothetical protein
MKQSEKGLQRQSKALTGMRSCTGIASVPSSFAGAACRFNRYDERCRSNPQTMDLSGIRTIERPEGDLSALAGPPRGCIRGFSDCFYGYFIDGTSLPLIGQPVEKGGRRPSRISKEPGNKAETLRKRRILPPFRGQNRVRSSFSTRCGFLGSRRGGTWTHHSARR